MSNQSQSGATPNERHANTTDERHTPVRLIRQLLRVLGGLFDLDPCSGCEPEPIAKIRYTEVDDGLSQPWFGTVFVNPPYSEIAAWMAKITSELSRESGPELIVALVPVRASADWFHEHATQANWIGLFDGRLTFGETGNQAPFPSGLLVFGEPAAIPDELPALMNARGSIFRLDDVSANDLTDKTTLEDFFSEPTLPSWASTIEVPPIKRGDVLRLEFDTSLGFPGRLPGVLDAGVVSIAEQDDQYQILCVSDESPKDCSAQETYVALIQRKGDPRDVRALACEDGTSTWRRVDLQAIERLT